MEENFATRLKLFMDTIGIASSQFADSCEIPRPSFSQLLSGRNQKVSDVLIKKIHSVYPELSIIWLMFGEGAMMNTSSENHDSDANTSEASLNENPEKNGNDSGINPNTGRNEFEYSNLKPLTTPENSAQNSLHQQLEESKRILELQMQIENLQKNPRKVTQITVYYDDSTFETFVPAKH